MSQIGTLPCAIICDCAENAWNRAFTKCPQSTPPLGVRNPGSIWGLQITGTGVIEAGPRGRIVCEDGIIRAPNWKNQTYMAEAASDSIHGYRGVFANIHASASRRNKLTLTTKHPRARGLMARPGMTFLAAQNSIQMPVVSYNAKRSQEEITGNGRASKEQVTAHDQRELGLAKCPAARRGDALQLRFAIHACTAAVRKT